ncbi:U2 small nuclear ribonucleoprotein auxiliary factor 35 kDa subunit-related protein 2 isoform X3 [Balearica regulorum gibbericeps]|uniref:U2 small nuclear ribonucleoprotein auxiliary factor 35 kDa subunit-related protein 2 isoform X3 n=1 Tax=Balearica regulorum gibbericeps TaxID=100784 RepID=UPI003F647617
MAAPMLLPESPLGKLSHQKYRAILKKEKRKKKRQALAKLRDSEATEKDESVSEEEEEELEEEEEEEEEEKKLEAERQKLHEQWLLREEKAQEEFKLKKEKEEAARKRQEEEERKIKEEWEEQQRKEREVAQQKQQEKREREAAVQRMLDQAESQLENGVTWHNPEPPENIGTEKDRANCPFYIKTGSCRFGDRCSRKHNYPTSSKTLLVRGMFITFGMEQCRRDDYDTDASLEYSDEETYQQFLEFYEDVLPEFQNVGKVVQFKVSCNYEPHLRGNVYVQYQSEKDCQAALALFSGRWYAGRQLHCEFCPVTRWKTAICDAHLSSWVTCAGCGTHGFSSPEQNQAGISCLPKGTTDRPVTSSFHWCCPASHTSCCSASLLVRALEWKGRFVPSVVRVTSRVTRQMVAERYLREINRRAQRGMGGGSLRPAR